MRDGAKAILLSVLTKNHRVRLLCSIDWLSEYRAVSK
jgi:hypothetical protein